MPITGITGLPGHGKSYGTVKHIIKPALEDGRIVVTNIPMTDKAHDAYPDQIQQLNLTDFDPTTYPHGSVVVLDEFWRLCPSGTRANNIDHNFKAFFAEHRHHVGEDGKTTEIVLVMQDFSQICTFVKSLVETTYRVRKLKIGSKQICKTDIYDGVAQGNPPRGKPMNTLSDSYEREIFDLYKTHMYSDGLTGVEQDVDSRRSMFNHPMIRYGIPGSILAIIVFSYMGYKQIVNIGKPDNEILQQKTEQLPIEQQENPHPIERPKVLRYGVVESAEEVPYRIVGYSQWGGLFPDTVTIVNPESYKLTLEISLKTDVNGIKFIMYEGYKVTYYTGRLSWNTVAREGVRVTSFDYNEH
ncbi:MAG: hypothetical protein CR991_02105 [Proteobacteria bacterium]|nr:MAG: hypothetical protein CR991_02105 [Pseudomonadota bacterium]